MFVSLKNWILKFVRDLGFDFWDLFKADRISGAISLNKTTVVKFTL